MARFLCASMLALTIAACGAMTTHATPATHPSIIVRVNMAVIGDSISGGYGSTFPPTDKFPMQIRITNRNISMNDQAMSGYTVADMQPYVPAVLASNPSYVMIELGTNDERDGHSLAQFQSDYTAMLAALHSVPHIGCLSIWPSPGNEANVNAFNSIILSLCGAANYIYISNLAVSQNEDNPAIPGNWHPNTQGAALIAAACDTWIEHT